MQAPESPNSYWKPSSITIWALFLALIILIAIAFFSGYLPLQDRRHVIAAEAREEQQAIPRVETVTVARSDRKSGLTLPGNIQPIAEAPILARADGYIILRLVDIGDRVKAGQPVAEIEAPELSDQINQAKAVALQAQAGIDQAQANYQQGKTELDLAKLTADRLSSLAGKGAVSRQDNDQAQAQYQARLASVQSLDKAIAVQRANLAAAQASVARLEKMLGYQVVRAPFDGVITVRNVETGALVTTGTTLLFRIAQVNTLRTYLNVPQNFASSVREGQAALITVSNLPGRQFKGTVARTSNSLDPANRTLLVEVHLPNPGNELLPGMYAEVELSSVRADPPVIVPSEALIVRADGTQVATVRPDNTIHLQKITPGRDYGDRLEVLRGLEPGDTVIANPGDVSEGMKIDPVHGKPQGAMP
ncbi:MAG: efflux transporter, family, subunit [Bryobacterales bacterium]|nr:efflux transporter, family, subunit [Bryobacterales bacterium]